MLVEDNVALGRLYRQVLEHSGLDVIQATSCQEAFDRLEEVVPAAMLLDLSLPDGDGSTIVDYVKERPRFNQTRIAVVSGNDQYNPRKSGIELFLLKPVSTWTLVDSVRKMLGTPSYSTG